MIDLHASPRAHAFSVGRGVIEVWAPDFISFFLFLLRAVSLVLTLLSFAACSWWCSVVTLGNWNEPPPLVRPKLMVFSFALALALALAVPLPSPLSSPHARPLGAQCRVGS